MLVSTIYSHWRPIDPFRRGKRVTTIAAPIVSFPWVDELLSLPPPLTPAPPERGRGRGKERERERPEETHLQSDHGILHVQPRIDRQSLRDRQQRVRKRLHSQLGPPLGDTLLRLVDEVLVRGDFERSGTGDEGAVLERVLDGTETVPDRVRDLRNGVRVRTCAFSGASRHLGSVRSPPRIRNTEPLPAFPPSHQIPPARQRPKEREREREREARMLTHL
jgi:hypothetical protein